MTGPPSADSTAKWLLRFRQEPSRFEREGWRRHAPALDAEVVLKLALGRRVSFADAALDGKALAASLQDAAATYVRKVYFRPDATPYQILGVSHGAASETIRENFRLLMQLVHPDRQDARGTWPESYAALANRAYATLRNQDSRARLDCETERRDAAARAVQRAAGHHGVSMMPVLQRPKDAPWGRKAAASPLLLEWLTAGVGGYVRNHPATTAFAVLIAGAALVVGFSLADGEHGMLVRATGVTAASVPAPRQPAEGPANAGPPVATTAPPSSAADGETVGEAHRAVSGATAGALQREAAPSVLALPREKTATVAGLPPERPESPIALAPGPAPKPAAAVPATPAVSIEAAPMPPEVVAAAPAAAPATAEIEALFATFVDSYERGRLDAFVALFDANAATNLRHGRAAIRSEYDELFRASAWRRMTLASINWRRVGERAYAEGELAVRIGWRDGREIEQRIAVEMELARQDGRVVITKLLHQPRSP